MQYVLVDSAIGIVRKFYAEKNFFKLLFYNGSFTFRILFVEMKDIWL